VNALVSVVNFLLSTAMWFILGRLVLSLFIRNEQNPIWQMFLIITEPPYRVSRVISAGRISERWIWLVSLAWLLAARILITRLYTPSVAA
jgi:hypothetical protein